MRYSKLDLGLAIAACARGYKCGRYSDENEQLHMVEGNIRLVKEHGKSVQFQYSTLFHDFISQDWYVIGDDKTWLERPMKG